MEEMSRQELIQHYADQICRGSVIDNTVDALFTAINNEIRCLRCSSGFRGRFV